MTLPQSVIIPCDTHSMSVYLPARYAHLSSFVHHYQYRMDISELLIFYNIYKLFCLWRFDPFPGHGLPLRGFAITLTGHTTVGRTPLDEWSARRNVLYLTTHDTHNRQTSMLPAGFEPAIPASERPQTHALECAGSGMGQYVKWTSLFRYFTSGVYIFSRDLGATSKI